MLPGSYRFEMRAANGDGVWNESAASLPVEVLPYFWEAPWFRRIAAGIFAIAAIGMGWTVARARTRRQLAALEAQNAREHERARIARDLHDDLGASLTEISLMAQLAAEEQTDSALPREALPEIAAKAQFVVGTLDEIVWAVNPRHDTLNSLAEYLGAFAGEFLEAAGITLRLDIPRGLPSIVLDAERRHNVFLAAREALNNAVKHSGASEIALQLRADEKNMIITISDNGRGFDSTPEPRGEGARNISTRLTQMGGVCTIDSAIGKGTKIRFTVPLRAG
jgi:signal transduction histidine kinase